MSATRLPEGLNQTNKKLGTKTVRTSITEKTISLPITFAEATTSEIETEFTVEVGTIVKAVSLNIREAEVTGSVPIVTVGTLVSAGGDIDGFMFDVDASTAVYVKGTLAAAAETLGDLLTVADAGANVIPESHLVAVSRKLVWGVSSTDWTSFEADIIIDLDVIE